MYHLLKRLAFKLPCGTPWARHLAAVTGLLMDDLGLLTVLSPGLCCHQLEMMDGPGEMRAGKRAGRAAARARAQPSTVPAPAPWGHSTLGQGTEWKERTGVQDKQWYSKRSRKRAGFPVEDGRAIMPPRKRGMWTLREWDELAVSLHPSAAV